MGIVTLSDPSGQYEAILFQEGLNQYRDLLEKGAAVLVTLQAHVEGEDVRARITTVEPLDRPPARPEGPAHFPARRAAALAHARLGRAAKAKSRWFSCWIARRGEVEVKLPGRFQVSRRLPAPSRPFRAWFQVEHV